MVLAQKDFADYRDSSVMPICWNFEILKIPSKFWNFETFEITITDLELILLQNRGGARGVPVTSKHPRFRFDCHPCS